jgi:hypothetical protein
MGGGQLVARDQLGQRPVDPGLGFLSECDVDVREQHFDAVLCNGLRDPRAHLPCPDHSDYLHRPYLRTCSKGAQLALLVQLG